MGKGRGGAVGTKFRTTLGKFKRRMALKNGALGAMAMRQDEIAKGHLGGLPGALEPHTV